MTYATGIILNAVFAALVLAGLAGIVWFGLSSRRGETLPFTSARDERTTERLAA
jgi:hypothetical protein